MTGVIINPKAGKSTYRRKLTYLFRMLRQEHISFDWRETRYAGHAKELARELVENGCRDLLVLGGDGTLSETVDGILHSRIPDKTQVTLGLIPSGTGNDWGRYWNLTRAYKKSIRIWLQRKRRQAVDVGCLTLWRNGEEERHYFINSVGFGIDAVTCARAQVLKYYVGSHGLNYFFGLLSAVFRHKALPVHIETEDGIRIEQPLFTMNIGNGPYSGGGIKQNPAADPRDGIFHCMFVPRPTWRVILSALPKLFNGRLGEIELLHSFKARTVIIRTHACLPIEKDGILVDACGPYRIDLLPAALHIIVP